MEGHLPLPRPPIIAAPGCEQALSHHFDTFVRLRGSAARNETDEDALDRFKLRGVDERIDAEVAAEMDVTSVEYIGLGLDEAVIDAEVEIANEYHDVEGLVGLLSSRFE